MKKLKILTALILVLTGLLTSCQTSPKKEVEPIPYEITWPAFPDPSGKVIVKDGVVTMSLEYWLSVARYAVEIDAAIETVEALKIGP